MKILIVEDDSEMREFLRDGFEAEGSSVDTADDGTKGSYLARTNEYDVVILDHSLPKKNGSIVCEEIRATGKNTPIIFLSVMGGLHHKVDSLEKGADDYITKPFSFEELRARVRAVMRRPHKIEPMTIQVADLVLNGERQTVLRGQTGIYLTRKEFNLLQYLMKNRGLVLSRGVIMEHVWNADSDPFSNTIESHILNLRKKINIGRKKDLIRNVPGRGYTIDDC
jgi:two-component system copper resistance phosphate regulon response regulator CusR